MAIEKEQHKSEIENILNKLKSEKFDKILQMCKGFKIEPLISALRVTTTTDVIDNKIVINFNLNEDEHIILFGSTFLFNIKEFLEQHQEVMNTFYESIRCYNMITKEDPNPSDYGGQSNYIRNISKISTFKPSILTLYNVEFESEYTDEIKYDLVKIYNERSQVDDNFFNFNGEMPIETWFLRDIMRGRTNTSIWFLPIFKGEKLVIKNIRSDQNKMQLQPNNVSKVRINNAYLLTKFP